MADFVIEHGFRETPSIMATTPPAEEFLDAIIASDRMLQGFGRRHHGDAASLPESAIDRVVDIIHTEGYSVILA